MTKKNDISSLLDEARELTPFSITETSDSVAITINRHAVEMEGLSVHYLKALIKNTIRNYNPICGYACRYAGSKQRCGYCADD